MMDCARSTPARHPSLQQRDLRGTMNHIYRVVFNRRLGIWQVASEKTRSHSRS
ncbi:MAG: hypothetical protein E2603_12115, partial [Achromobacter sp.]|nr:hypothetical protein [Achromobacter sp.]